LERHTMWDSYLEGRAITIFTVAYLLIERERERERVREREREKERESETEREREGEREIDGNVDKNFEACFLSLPLSVFHFSDH
jgi:hypothetical protein